MCTGRMASRRCLGIANAACELARAGTATRIAPLAELLHPARLYFSSTLQRRAPVPPSPTARQFGHKLLRTVSGIRPRAFMGIIKL